jgi:hypothetical protein
MFVEDVGNEQILRLLHHFPMMNQVEFIWPSVFVAEGTPSVEELCLSLTFPTKKFHVRGEVGRTELESEFPSCWTDKGVLKLGFSSSPRLTDEYSPHNLILRRIRA